MENQNVPVWHSQDTYAKITIRHYANARDYGLENPSRDDRPDVVREMTDRDRISQILSMLDALPVRGEEMMRFSPDAGLIVLELASDEKTEYVHIYGNHVKTPSTGYVSNETDRIKERALVGHLWNLLEAPL